MDEGGREGELQALARRITAGAAARWPAISLSEEALAVALRSATDVELASVRGEDLFLATACALGDPQAHAVLEREELDAVTAAARQLRAPDAVIDEARQVVRAILLVRQGDRPPAIATFRGRSALRSFIHVIAVREILRLLRKGEQPVEDSRALDAVLSPEADPELGLMKETYRREVGAAFREALDSLTPRQRNVLRLQCIEGLTSEQMGVLYRVHASTVFRWAQRAKERVVTRTRRILAERLHVEAAELNSILRVVQSRFDLSLERVLGTDEPDDELPRP